MTSTAITSLSVRSNVTLESRTSAQWASQVLRDPLALLGDHAWLERKAAANALDLLGRWPDAACATRWVDVLTTIARDETQHLQAVSRLLAARGGVLPRVHRNPYATALHGLVRRGQGPLELLDRLLVSALIEARSCERFERLAECATEPELATFYRGLKFAEAGHHQAFVELAGTVIPAATCVARWAELAGAEARIVAAQAPGPRLHGGVIA